MDAVSKLEGCNENSKEGNSDVTSDSEPRVEDLASHTRSLQAPRPPSLRSTYESGCTASMTASSTPLGNVNAARRPLIPQSVVTGARGSQLPQDMQAKMRAFHLSRQGTPAISPQSASGSGSQPSSGLPNQPIISTLSAENATDATSPPSTASSGGVPDSTALRHQATARTRPCPPNFNSAPAVPNIRVDQKMGLAAKRGLNRSMKLSDASGTQPVSQKSLVSIDGSTTSTSSGDMAVKSTGSNSLFNQYAEYVDTATGTLKFKGKATIHGRGIEFSSGMSFNISLDEVDTLDELGKGNYGTVYKVRHSRPQLRRPGQGLRGCRVSNSSTASSDLSRSSEASNSSFPVTPCASETTGVIMAMKEIRLELDEAKFAAIIMELDILHRCISPYIVDFYGAFFQEGAVYICMEYMDGGSIDKLYGDGMPERVLRKITYATVMGLKSLKDDHNIIHRDVKPTNILINTRGQVKICDFGVSGNLVASIAKTNIGCQSYMAPERISGGGIGQAGMDSGATTYSVQSDIWSLGLTIIECALGQYPYPPETYDNIFSQLSVSRSSPSGS